MTKKRDGVTPTEKATTPNLDKKGVDSTAGTPGTNTPGGELDKQQAAENSPGAQTSETLDGPTGNDGPIGTNGEPGNEEKPETGSLEAPNDPNATAVIPGTSLTEEKTEALAEQVSPESQTDVKEAGDGNFSINGVVFNKLEIDNLHLLGVLVDNKLAISADEFNAEVYKLVTDADLEKYPELKPAGVTVNDTRKSAMEKLEVFKNAPDQSGPGPDTQTTNPPPPVVDREKETKGKSGTGTAPLYHGDFLNEQQVNDQVPVTYNWDEVTAPEHEQYRPKAD